MRIDNIAILGAKGRMGALFCARAHMAGMTVAELDQPLEPTMLQRSLEHADMVLLCVPAKSIAQVLKAMSDLLSKKQILADITSVKMLPMQQMRSSHQGPVVGTHPLFGPSPDPEDMRVAVMPARQDASDNAACTAVEACFRRMGCSTFRTTAEAHDRAAARVQGLNFITSVAYFATLGHDEEITPFLTPSFCRRLKAAKSMLTEDAALFEVMFEANPYSQEAVRAFRAMLNYASAGDVNLLVERAAWWWRQTERIDPSS